MSAPYDEQRLDSIVWPKLSKRFRECTPDELDRVIAALNAETAESLRRIAATDRWIAATLAKVDQYEAVVADGVNRAEQWANGGAS